MKIEEFVSVLDSEFFTGVPDSLLKPLSSYLMNTYGIDPKHHIIAANEGNAVGLAAGYYLATQKHPVVYLQNSGEGNIINPVASLLNDKVYGIPTIFVVGYRGEPGVHDEPQHVFQGEVTIKLLEDMDIKTFVVSNDTTKEDINNVMNEFKDLLSKGKQAAFVVKKNALDYDQKVKYINNYSMSREEVIKHIIKVSKEDPIISTTGKASRELFEARVANGQSHQYDFLTVGSMGHASSIALGVAINKPNKKVWCIDGDGAAIMHMGSLATIGSIKPNNLVHVLINNTAHESVGGMPTVANITNFVDIARACGYENVESVSNYDSLDNELIKAKQSNELSFIEVKCCISARENLGRPTTTSQENKDSFIFFISNQR